MRKIGIDLHGVLTEWPELLQPILKEMIKDNEIHIITGPPIQETAKELENLGYIHGIHYSYVFSMVDYLRQHKINMWQDEKGTWWCDDYNWWSCKGKYCMEHHIDVVFDDSIQYKKYMPKFTEFNLILPHGRLNDI